MLARTTRRTRLLIMFAGAVLVAIVAAGWMRWRTTNISQGHSQVQQVGDLRIGLEIDRAEPGTREVFVAVKAPPDQPNVSAVRLRFTMAEMDMGQIEADTVADGQGRFRAQGPFFTMVGQWLVEATLERVGSPPVVVSFAVPVAAPGEQGGPVSPLAADAAALGEGQRLYAANCSACHGDTGQGDGPSAAGLDPRPANFTQHMLPGQHTDGQVFLWIKEGYPGTAMPAWGTKLSDEQIWQLVAYLRTFATTVQAQPPIEPLPPILFARGGGIWRGEGQNTQQVPTPNGTVATHLALSPDGRQLAFVGVLAPKDDAHADPTSELYVADADGSNMRMLWQPGQGMIGQITWSADSMSIYAGIDGLRVADAAIGGMRLQEIVKIDVTSGAIQPFLEDALEPTMSMDGSRIAYLRAADSATEERAPIASLEISTPDGAQVTQLVDAAHFDVLAAPRFSPDGSKIVFTAHERADANMQSARPGSPTAWLRELIAPPVAEAHGQTADVWVVNSDGSGLRMLAQLSEDDPVATFSSDGREIVVLAGGGIYRMNADGSELRKIDGQGGRGGIEWLR